MSAEKKAEILVDGLRTGILAETDQGWVFQYYPAYDGPAVSLTMPLRSEPYEFDSFPPFFDGLLPEGAQLESLLKAVKLDRSDYLGQLMVVGADLVGNTTIKSVDA